MDDGLIVQLIMLASSFIGVVIIGWAAYQKGKEDAAKKQLQADNKALDQIEEELTNPRPSSNDDRNSMRDGNF